ncbi:LysR family transcriptional regulator [Rhizobium sp. Root1204]|uniref:LysR family transcriptional regulator n=1 Tax=Rhizobium sp. Root1204 TaxID=1736428 RepID=UPI00071241F9|nr:LysR family transcriptional regulator [Rhizobium sp. Root1204]KQV27353.1 LysR family transcriptional regulator [Rhizobium sp. Root1204]
MDRLQSMRVLVKVADTGSFAQAARVLNMSPPAVTRAIACLEDLTGARLFLRSTRSVKLTAPGSRYVEDCRRILADIDEAEASAGGSHATPSGLLTVTAPVLFGQIYVMPVMTSFLTLHPAVNGRALLLDRVVNLLEEGIDVALRIGQLPDSGYHAIKVGSVRRVVCGAPSYFKDHPVPQVPADLAGHTIIANTGSSAPQDWRFVDGEKSHVTLRPRLFCNTVDASISAALSGWGLTSALSYQVASAVRDGTLDIVLAGYEEPPIPIHVMHAEGRHISAKTRAFVDFLVAQLRDNRNLQAAASLMES